MLALLTPSLYSSTNISKNAVIKDSMKKVRKKASVTIYLQPQIIFSIFIN
jgi:hypothetical protein